MYLFSICKCILNDFGLFVCLYLTCKFIVVSIVKSMKIYRKKVEFNVGWNSIRIHLNQVCAWMVIVKSSSPFIRDCQSLSVWCFSSFMYDVFETNKKTNLPIISIMTEYNSSCNVISCDQVLFCG